MMAGVTSYVHSSIALPWGEEDTTAQATVQAVLAQQDPCHGAPERGYRRPACTLAEIMDQWSFIAARVVRHDLLLRHVGACWKALAWWLHIAGRTYNDWSPP